MTTEQTPENTNKAADWQAAIAASAEAQRPEDPKPKALVEELDCKLTDREHAAIAIEHANAIEDLETFDEETKSLVANRKAERAKLEAAVKTLHTAVLTGRQKRRVNVLFYVSLSQNRSYKVRLDTKQEYGEKPLQGNERQATLPLGDEGEDGDDENEDDDLPESNEQLHLNQAVPLPEHDDEEEDAPASGGGDGLVREVNKEFIEEMKQVAAGGTNGTPVEDSTTNLQGDPDHPEIPAFEDGDEPEPDDGTVITDPAKVLKTKRTRKKSK